MSRYGIDTTAPASFLLQGFQTGANTAETRLRREQQQAQFDVNQQNYQNELAAQAARQAELKQQRQYAADALHAAVMEQLSRTKGMRPTYGETPGPFAGEVLDQPMPDESDTQWQAAADAARAKGNVEGLEVLLKEGGTREKRVRNSQLVRHFRDSYGGNANLLADDNMRMLYTTLESADDPAALVQRHYEQQDQERRMLARQQAARAAEIQQQQSDQKSLEPAYRVLSDPNATREQRAWANSVIASLNAPGTRSGLPFAEMDESQIQEALADVPEPERTRLYLAWKISGKRPAAGTVASQLGQGARQQADQAKVGRTAADKALATAEKEYRALAGQSGKQGQLTPPTPKDIENAKYASEGRSQFWTKESTEQKSLMKVQAWERYQQAKEARDAAYGTGGTPQRPSGETIPNYEDGPGSGVPGDPAPVDEPADADTVVLELMDKGLSDEEIAAELRRRGYSP